MVIFSNHGSYIVDKEDSMSKPESNVAMFMIVPPRFRSSYKISPTLEEVRFTINIPGDDPRQWEDHPFGPDLTAEKAQS